MIPQYLHLRYFPLKKGNYWELTTQAPKEEERITIRIEVEDRQNMPAGIMYRLRYRMGEEDIMMENLIVDHQGIWIHSRFIEGTMFLYDPPFPLLPANYKELKWWNWQGTIGTVESKATMIYEGNAHLTLEGEEESVLCIKVKFTEENKYGSSTYIRYYGEHLGIVKEIADTNYYSYEAIITAGEVDYDDYSYVEELEKNLARILAEEESKAEEDLEGLPEEIELEEEDLAELEEAEDTVLDEETEDLEELEYDDLDLPETIELSDEDLEEMDLDNLGDLEGDKGDLSELDEEDEEEKGRG